MTRVLKPGGEFLLLVINQDGWIRASLPFLVHHGYFGGRTNADRWRTQLEAAGFEMVEQGTRPGRCTTWRARHCAASRACPDRRRGGRARPAPGAKVSSGTVRAACIILWLGLLAAGCSRGEPVPGARVPPLASGAARGQRAGGHHRHAPPRPARAPMATPAGLTPTLDALAAAACDSTHAFSHVPHDPAGACLHPHRTHPARHGLRINGAARLADDVPTLATVFAAPGYRTGAFVGAFVLDARYGLGRGFDDYDDRYPQSGETSVRLRRTAGRRTSSRRPATGFSPPTHVEPVVGVGAPVRSARALRRARRIPPGPGPDDAEVAYADAMLGRLLDRLRQARRAGPHAGRRHRRSWRVARRARRDDARAVRLRRHAGRAAHRQRPRHRPRRDRGAVGHADLLPTMLRSARRGGARRSRRPLADRAAAPPTGRVLRGARRQAHARLGAAYRRGPAGGSSSHLPEPELYDLAADAARVATTSRIASRSRRRARRSARALVPRARASTAAPAAPLDADADRRACARSATLRRFARFRRPPTRAVYSAADDPKRLVALNERFNTALEAFNAGRAAEALDGVAGGARPSGPTSPPRGPVRRRCWLATGRAARGGGPAPRRARRPGRARPRSRPSSAPRCARPAICAARPRPSNGPAPPATATPNCRTTSASSTPGSAASTTRARPFRSCSVAIRAPPAPGTTWACSNSRPRVSEAAAEAFRQAVAADPSRGDAWQGLGAALVEHDRAGAIDAWRRAERLLPRDYDLLFNLGMVLAERSAAARGAALSRRDSCREAPRDRYGRRSRARDAPAGAGCDRDRSQPSRVAAGV